MEERRPRLSFDITEEQMVRKNKLIPLYGLQRSIFSVILDDVLDLIEEHGLIICGSLIEKYAKPRDIIPSLQHIVINAKEGK
jgi:hypothetical protein